MRVDRICYEQLFPTGVYANQRLRIEISVEDEGNASQERVTEVYKVAQTLVQNAFNQMNPPAEISVSWEPPYGTGGDSTAHPTQKTPSTLDHFIREINSCTSIDETNKVGVQVGLMAYKELAMSNPQLQEAYNNKMEELTHG